MLYAFFGGATNSNNPALHLAAPLLWAAMSNEMEGRMDGEQRQRIRDAFAAIGELPEGINPVIKNSLTITRVNAECVIVESHGNGSHSANPQPPVGAQVPQQQVAPSPWMQQHIELLWNGQREMRQLIMTNQQATATMMSNQRSHMDRRLDILQQNMCRITVQPPRMATPGQRATNFAALGLEERRGPNGRTVVRLDNPVDNRP